MFNHIMDEIRQSSLTGSESGAPPTHTTSVSTALTGLRRSVARCCWIVAVALARGIYIYPCEAAGVEPADGVRWCEAR